MKCIRFSKEDLIPDPIREQIEIVVAYDHICKIEKTHIRIPGMAYIANVIVLKSGERIEITDKAYDEVFEAMTGEKPTNKID